MPDGQTAPESDPSPIPDTQTTLKKLRRYRILVIICLALIVSTGIFFAVKALIRPDYYKEGLKVTQIIGEMLQNDDYASIASLDANVQALRESIRQSGFSDPIAVYSLKIKDPDTILREVVYSQNPESEDLVNRLPASIKQQIANRYTVSMIIPSMINAAYGSEALIIQSLYTAIYDSHSLDNAEETNYLYIFENVSVLVTFNKGGATGQIVLPGLSAAETRNWILQSSQSVLLMEDVTR